MKCLFNAGKDQLIGDLLMFKKTLIFSMALVALVGCSENKTENPTARTISADSLEPWPFSFDEATIRCEYQPKAVIEANGKFYALNGAGSPKSPSNGFIQLTAETPEWLENSEIPGTKIPIGDTLKLVNETCKQDKK